MDWDEESAAHNNGSIFIKVMTDEQIEVLRQQIAAYATICQQLVELHKSYTSQHDLSGVRLGNIYNDPSLASSGHKITGRQRWTPTPIQLQILEGIFDQGNGTPSKQKIKEITSDLSQHGPISETNVYNWFQNRRARSKRKQSVSALNNAESEVETEVDSPNENKPCHQNFAEEDLCLQNPEVSSEMQCVDPESNKVDPIFTVDNGSKNVEGLGEISFYERMEHLVGKMERPVVTYDSYSQTEEDFNPTG